MRNSAGIRESVEKKEMCYNQGDCVPSGVIAMYIHIKEIQMCSEVVVTVVEAVVG